MSEIILDWDEYIDTARTLVAEGFVLLENRSVLPIQKNSRVSIFGRIQDNYYKSGTGSGGMVNVTKVIGIPEGLERSGLVTINEELHDIYLKWEEKHPFNEGRGWGTEPWSQEEMEVDEALAKKAAADSDIAIVIIGRTAGEDKDFTDTAGAYKLTKIEEEMLTNVRNSFEKMVVIFNIASIMDFSFFETVKPDAMGICWVGGMVGGDGVADVLLGKVSPSGRLMDTVALDLKDYPSDKYFGDLERNCYAEDIYVGYRYFETFAQDKVKYPFGYGLSYSSFKTEFVSANNDVANRRLTVSLRVTNTGAVAGKNTTLAFVACPAGALGKPSRVLFGYKKTGMLESGEAEIIEIEGDYDTFASFDDTGVTGNIDSFVLEEGQYDIYVGDNVREASKVYTFTLEQMILLEKVTDALGPVLPFERFVNKNGKLEYEAVPLSIIDDESRRREELPQEIVQNFENKYALKDVYDGKLTIEEFVACLTDDDLICIVRGEGMGSSQVTPGTAAAFGGVTDSLKALGIPVGCCDDGPSGMRLDSGMKAFSLPGGNVLSCSCNPELVEKLFEMTGIEMRSNKVECLLGPGMNIHRHPLNGRNFEYFSEDPYVTGVMGSAMMQGLANSNVTGTAKHFCCNNQESGRQDVDAVVSKRALREIYLKAFEMCAKNKTMTSVMTTYGQVNGLWTAGSYDLNTLILRKDWGFDGIVMTDWWAKINNRGQEAYKENLAAMVRAQNDIYMVVPDSSENPDNLKSELENGTLTRGELQRCAINICRFIMKSEAMKRLLNIQDTIKIVGREDEEGYSVSDDTEYTSFEDEIRLELEDRGGKATDYIIPLDIVNVGWYEVTVTAKSSLSNIAQLPCTLYYTGVPFLTFTFNGTEGKSVSITKKMPYHNRMAIIRLNVPKNGLELEAIQYKRVGDLKEQYSC